MTLKEIKKTPQWPEVRDSIENPARTESVSSIAQRFELPVRSLVRYSTIARRRQKDILATASDMLREEWANKILNMHLETFNAAKADHDKAMSRTKRGVGSAPDFASADLMLKNMSAAAESLGGLIKPEPKAQPQHMINPVFGNQKIQVLAMPKLPEASRTKVLTIDARKEETA